MIELMSKRFFKVIFMVTRRLCLAALLLVIGCQQAGVGADKPALSANEREPVSQKDSTIESRLITEAELDKQLKINRDTLLKGPSDHIRVDAASVMLFSEDPMARRVLLAALRQTENSAARAAICKALSQARAAQRPIKDKGEFIEPLFEILGTDDFATAKLAAEATLIFEYEQKQKQLEKMATDPSLPVRARLNAIYALKLQPDMRAIFKLMDLLDDSESQAATAAQNALQSLGIPVGKNRETRKQIKEELQRKGVDEFLRYWLNSQEKQIRELETERDFWRKQYLGALDMMYDDIKDEAAKGRFLAERLNSSEAKVRLWALEKVYQGRVGTPSKSPVDLGPVLVNLISDQNKDVRLKTAKLLSLMGELNSAPRLLEQLKIEQDDEVRLELFVALGGACYYAFLPNSGIKISPEIRQQTLEWAVKYLSEEQVNNAQKGAEVIKKLLEQDGLTLAEVDRYLGLLAKRYNQEKDKTDGTLRGELLSAMAGLCTQSIYKAESAKLFRPLFEEALTDSADLVREAAVDGLVYIDKARALKILRKDFVNDSSIMVKKKLIELSSEVGGQEDLVWLAEKLTSGAESEPAWEAMLKIFRRSDAAVIDEWLNKLGSENAQGKLSEEQMLSLLEIAEKKASSENKLEMLNSVRTKLVDLYMKNGKFEQAAERLGLLYQATQATEEKELILARLLDAHLRSGRLEAAGQLVANQLLVKDLEPNNIIVLLIDSYFAEPPAGADPNSVLAALTKIKTLQARPMWAEKVKRWAENLSQHEDKEATKPKGAGN